MTYEVLEQTPSSEEYCQLRLDAGLSAKSLEAAHVGLSNSLYTVCVRDSNGLVGMGRVIGDGACFFQIVDIAVNPNHQGLGLGKTIMEKIESYLEKAANDGSYVSLIADKPEFYEKLGFDYTAPEAYGMYKRLKKKSLMTRL
ncbi:GNAT family N-acetyltransferase [Enterovibrio norvegicus]|uniref:GNAT family N-acetyltransferase n=1 Tax=Enterovibrio norvegicus TaxID=188144 RepID=UPI0035530014